MPSFTSFFEAISIKIFTARIRDSLRSHYSEVSTEWRSAIGPTIYSPRLDIAVGPFSLIDGCSEEHAYNELCERSYEFLHHLIDYHKANAEDPRSADDIFMALLRFNPNSRCFLAIEIENEVSQKHLLGGALNASVLGRVALAVGFNQKSHNAFLRLKRYFSFLKYVGKNSFDADNLLVITPKQLRHCIQGMMLGNH